MSVREEEANIWKKRGDKESNNLLKHFCYGKYNQIIQNDSKFLNLPSTFPSSLSDKVQNLVLFEELKNDTIESLLNENFTLNLQTFKKINLIINANTEDEEFLNASTFIQIYSIQIEKKFNKMSLEDFKTIPKENFTLISKEDMSHIFELHKTKRSLLSFSMASSLLENALGDLLNLHKVEVPTKLSEILSLKKLKELLGEDLIFLLKLMIGPLNGLNLRNICLHGFITPKEFPSSYAIFLIVLILTVSSSFSVIEHRPLKNYHIKNLLIPSIESIDENELLKVLQTSLFVIPGREECWVNCIKDFFNGKYKDSLLMLFPLIEHSIRRIYVIVNECTDRLLTAGNQTILNILREGCSLHHDGYFVVSRK
jgi:hypothetical protein